MVDPTVKEEWGRRVIAEYSSALISQEFTLLIMRLGAPPDLIRDGMRVAAEELNHAEISLEVFRECGGVEMPSVDPAAAALAGQDTFLTVLRTTLQVFCLGETVAVPLFSNLRRNAKQDSVKRVFDIILKDEVGHRQFGWDCLDWLILAAGQQSIVSLTDELLPQLFAEVIGNYGRPQDSDDSADWPESLRDWGLAPPAEYAQILEATFAKEYQPRFKARGIDAQSAWQLAQFS